MWEKIGRWFRGYVKIKLQGISQERFLNICRGQNIYIWKLHRRNGDICGYIYLEDFWNLKIIARKTGVIPYVEEKIGFPFFWNRLSKRKGIYLGFLSAICILYGLSLFVWEIHIEGQHYHTREQLLTYLEQCNVRTGQCCNRIDCAKLEEQIRRKYTDIAWVSAKLEGTRLSISIVETKKQNKIITHKGGRHLIAPCNGRITKMVTRIGVPKVVSGQSVKKGDILIAGIITYQDDSEQIVGHKPVWAEGKVELQYDKKVTFRTPKIVQKKKYTGKKHNIYTCRIAGKKFYVTNPLNYFHKMKKYDIIANVNKFSLKNKLVLPIYVGRYTYREYTYKTVAYPDTVLKKQLLEQYAVYKKYLPKDQQIQCLHSLYRKEGNDYILQVHLRIHQVVHAYKRVKSKEWRLKQTDELNRNHDGSANGT